MFSARRRFFHAIAVALCAAAAACRPPYANRVTIENGLVSPRGDWVLLRGSPRAGSGSSVFLKNPVSGREVPLGSAPGGEPSQRSFAFAADGSRAAWMRERSGSGRAAFELLTLDLNRSDAAPVRLGEALDILPQPALSPDGRRAAFLAGRVLQVFDVSSGDPAASIEVSDWRMPRSVYFAADGHLRLYPRSRLDPPASSVHDLLELDPRTGDLVATGRAAVISPGALFRPSAAGDVAILIDGSRSRISLCDAQTGEERAVFPAAGELRGAGFLAGGRVAAIYRTKAEGTAVRVFDSGGREQAALEMAARPAAVVVLGEPADGRLAIATNPVGANSTRTWSVVVLDLAGRRVVRTWPDLAPLDPLEFWTAPALPEVSRRPKLAVLDPKGRLVQLDAAGR